MPTLSAFSPCASTFRTVSSMRLELDKVYVIFLAEVGAAGAKGIRNVFRDIEAGKIPPQMGGRIIDKLIVDYAIVGDDLTFIENLKATITAG